jgi:hypothetical protein
MLVASRHAQILVPKQLRDGVNVSTLHAEPTRRRMLQVVKSEVDNFLCSTDSCEGHAHLLGRDARITPDHLTLLRSMWGRSCRRERLV